MKKSKYGTVLVITQVTFQFDLEYLLISTVWYGNFFILADNFAIGLSFEV